MNAKRWWILPLLVLGALLLVVGAAVSGYVMATNAGAPHEATDVGLAATPEIEVASTTTSTSGQVSGGEFEERSLDIFDGSIRLGGTVSEGWEQASMSWIEDDEGGYHLAIEGTVKFNLAGSYCIDKEVCDWSLLSLKSGDHFAWTLEHGLGTTEVLHHAITEGELLSACWSVEHDAPVVSVVESDDSAGSMHVDRAWVMNDWLGDAEWLQIPAGGIDVDEVLVLPFAGYDLPSCSTAIDPDGAPATTTTTAEPVTTTTLPDYQLHGHSAQIRDFLIAVMDLERQKHPSQYEYLKYSADYFELARIWDLSYRKSMTSGEREFGRIVSEALIRRGDEYRLWDKWVTESGTMEPDDPFYGPAQDAREEADWLFDEIRDEMPEKWLPSTGVAGSANESDVFSVPDDDGDARERYIASSGLGIGVFVVGDCLENGEAGGWDPLVPTDCSGNSIEIYWIEDLSVTQKAYPGDERMKEIVDSVCEERIQDRYPQVWNDGVSQWMWSPSSESWEYGDRMVTCAYEV